MNNHLESLVYKYPALISLTDDINAFVNILENCFNNEGKLLIAGNGGSASDCDHIAGELLKGFCRPRRIPQSRQETVKGLSPEENIILYKNLQQGLPVIPLPGFNAFSSAFSNDENGDLVYTQLVEALACKQDIFLGISTSGNSKNVVYAAAYAASKGVTTLALTGRSGGRLADICDYALKVPADKTPDIQEYHLPVYHAICLMLEDIFFGDL